MHLYRNKNRIIAALAAAVLLCSGCLNKDMEELFTIPRPSEEYLDLENAIDEVLASGAGYSSPTGGNYRQSVQLMDIDGDGASEAVAFFSASGENPLKLYVFKNAGDGYETMLRLEGEGTGFASVDYADLDGDGWLEIVTARQLSNELRMLTVYSVKDYQATALLTADFAQYVLTDINGDELKEMFIFRQNLSELTGTVQLCGFTGGSANLTAEESLSNGMESIARIKAGRLEGGTNAIFVDGTYQGGVVTDIIALKNGKLRNITRSAESGASLSTVRQQVTYCRDIDGDGIVEVPLLRNLPTAGSAVYRVIDWESFSSIGRSKIKATTYHNFSDGWYLTLPKEWGDLVTIRRDDSVSGERAVIFSLYNGPDMEPSDFLAVYALTGENREDKAARDGRFILRREDEVIYAAKLLDGASGWELAPDAAYVRANFSLIYSEWNTGLI